MSVFRMVAGIVLSVDCTSEHFSDLSHSPFPTVSAVVVHTSGSHLGYGHCLLAVLLAPQGILFSILGKWF